MRLVTYLAEEGPRVAVMVNDHCLDLQSAYIQQNNVPSDHLVNMLSLLDGGEEAQALVQGLLDKKQTFAECFVQDPSLLAPVPRPRSMRDCMAFEKHLLQATRGAADILYPPVGKIDRFLAGIFGRGFLSVPNIFHEFPAYYKGNPASVTGPNTQIQWPSGCKYFDYELEFGVFIGKAGKNIKEADAAKHIAGFCLFNDFSDRGTQLKEMKQRLGPAKGKDFDTGNAMGPYLVTADEVPNPYDLRLTAKVDDQLWTDARSDGMAHSFEEIIAYISKNETLYPGDFIGAGTVGGGCGLEHGRWLKPGQVIEISADGLGTLRNVISEPST